MLSAAIFKFLFSSSVLVLLQSSTVSWIDDVTVYPTELIHPEDQINIEVLLTTVHAEAFLYQPTTVSIQGNDVFIDLYVNMGPVHTLDHLTVPVEVGHFSAGDHGYTVSLHDLSGKVVDSVNGNFQVVPSIPALGPYGVAAMSLLLACAGAIIHRRARVSA